MLSLDILPCLKINVAVMIIILSQTPIASCHSVLDDGMIKIPLTKRAARDQMHDGLPGQTQKLNIRQFSGYLQGIDSNRLHYVFYECEFNSSRAPLILWMNGGPGCSSMAGLFLENGPFTLIDDFKLKLRNTSWHKFANIIYLESPGGTGYSYNRYNRYQFSDNTVTDSNYQAILDFFTVFPWVISNSFYIAAESYGGFHAPLLAKQLLIQKSKINLKGIILVSGITDWQVMHESTISYGYHHGLLNPLQWQSLQLSCCHNGRCQYNLSTDCQEKFQKAYQYIMQANNNIYNIHQYCYDPNNSSKHLRSISQILTIKLNTTYEEPRCFHNRRITQYLRHSRVRQAFNISPFGRRWEICNHLIGKSYIIQYQNMDVIYNEILSKLRILTIYGDLDAIVSFNGGLRYFTNLWISNGRELLENYRPWHFSHPIGKQIGGYTANCSNFQFVIIKGAGHMVMADKPNLSYMIVDRFLKNLELN